MVPFSGSQGCTYLVIARNLIVADSADVGGCRYGMGAKWVPNGCHVRDQNPVVWVVEDVVTARSIVTRLPDAATRKRRLSRGVR
jgi:hypothetical protein